MKTILIILCSFMCFSTSLFGNASSEKTQQTSKTISPILNNWCWNELESFNSIDVHCASEDNSNQLWFATTGNLLHYDGYKIEKHPFPKEFQDSGAIDLHISQKDDIYVYTNNGLIMLSNGEWHVLQRLPYHMLTYRQVIQETKSGNIYIITYDGICQIAGTQVNVVIPLERTYLTMSLGRDSLWVISKGKIHRYQLLNGEISLERAPDIYKISDYFRNKQEYRIVANKNDDAIVFSIATRLDPFIFDKSSNQFKQTGLLAQFGAASYYNAVYLGENEEQLLLLGSSQNFLRTDNGWERLKINSMLPLNSMNVLKRSNGNLIIGGRYETVYEIDYSGSLWESFAQLNFYCESQKGNYWFISIDGKILEYNPKSLSWTLHNGKNMIDTPITIIESSNGGIWVSGSDSEIAAVSYYDGVKWRKDSHQPLLNRMSHLSAIELSNKQVLFGSGNDSLRNGGLVIYHPVNPNDSAETKYQIEYYSYPEVPRRIEGIAEGIDGIYFAGLELYKWIPGQDHQVLSIPNHSTRWIDALSTDRSGTIWTGSLDNTGVNKWNGKNWSHLSGRKHLRSDQIIYIANDKITNDMWITCSRGISKYGAHSDSWISKVLPDELSFKRESGMLQIDRQGNLWINKSLRSWYFRNSPNYKINEDFKKDFYTTKYSPDRHPPKISIISTTHNNYNEPANILINWKGIDYYSITPTEKLAYSYKINGENWSKFTSSTELILDDLKSGMYNIQVRCRDLDGNISLKAATTTIQVHPVIWKKTWFISIVIVITTALIGLIILTVYLKVQNIIQIESFKSQFFMNMSHELRTPLTVIMGPLESIRKSHLPKKIQLKVDIAYKNSQKMLSLVDQLLNFRRLTAGKYEKKFQHSDIISYISNEVESIRSLFDNKNQSLHLECSHETFDTWFESDKLEHILGNLLSNASKYTQRNGAIQVEALLEKNNKTHDQLILSIIDNGPGIPKSYAKKIFDPFFRIQKFENSDEKGTGLGLAFVKELVDSMKGNITLLSPVSDSNKGTRFTINLPLPKNPDATEQGRYDETKNLQKIEEEDSLKKDHLKENRLNKPKILLTEDDPDIKKYLSIELTDTYDIIEAENGEVGFLSAKEHIPDIIISDVLMPKVDGFSFCEKIKSTNETSHIPVIMLTALKADEHELKALQKGADGFVSKPISLNILKQKIKNLLILREQLHRKFEIQKAQGKFNGKSITSNQSDEAFINKIIQIIEESYHDPKFDVETIASKMFMSRVTLYRKFKAITGESPSQFIKTQRMNKAVDLLKNTNYTVSEISDMVGYSDPSYLGATFKSQFGCTPKQFRKNNQDPQNSNTE